MGPAERVTSQYPMLVPRPNLILGLCDPHFLGNLCVNTEVPMNKKYIVRLTDEERAI